MLLWRSNLEIGNESVDSQHKALFEAVNEFNKLTTQGKAKEEIKKYLEFMGNYAIQHFKEEEEYQASIGYPDIEEHKKLHKLFIKDFLAFKADFDKGSGVESALVIKMNKFLSDWLFEHVSMVDKKIGDYAKSK